MNENYGWVRMVCVVLSLILVAMGAWEFWELVCALPGQVLSWLAELSVPKISPEAARLLISILLK